MGLPIMDRHHRLLLNVWREACRHIEIVESLDRIAPLLVHEFPADVILIRRISADRNSIETVASTSGRRPRKGEAESKTECTADQMQALLAWANSLQMRRASADSIRRDLPGALPAAVRGHVLLGALRSEQGHYGMLIIACARGAPIGKDQESLFRALLDPFAAALENDRRLHELVTLRERVEAENRRLLSKLGRSEASDIIVGAESGLREVMQRVHLVARAEVPVLILGETGSGKEVVARSIHGESNRANGPFLRVNCGAISPELIDSELFGHEKGSFSGAVNLRKGWFERADGGTLFLDECGELPPAAQVRLLRVLQDGSFDRVGGERSINVSVRVVAATHRDLKAMVADRSFREDLWYRLAVFPIHLPALRDRPADIPAMARHFAARAACKLGLKVCVPDERDTRLLLGYSWPGNVRELASVMERAAILGDGARLDVATALGAGATTNASPVLPAENRQHAATIIARFPGLDEAMAAHIRSALHHAKGRIEGPHGAANLLGINPHTLRSRMRKLAISWQAYREGKLQPLEPSNERL